MPTTYTKLKDGSWGLRSTETIRPGQSVTVTTKGGEAKTEVVGRVLWTGNGITLATKAGTPQARSTGRSGGRRRGGREGICWECGASGWLDQDGMCGQC